MFVVSSIFVYMVVVYVNEKGSEKDIGDLYHCDICLRRRHCFTSGLPLSRQKKAAILSLPWVRVEQRSGVYFTKFTQNV